MPDSAPPPDAALAQVLGPARLAYFTPVSEYPVIADRKASFLLTASGLLTTVLIFFANPIVHMVRGVAGGTASARIVGAGVAIAAAVVVVCLLCVAVIAYRAYIFPAPPMPPSLANFRHLAALAPDEYRAAVLALNHPEALRDVLHYNYSITRQAAGKFRRVNLALRIMRVAILVWMAMLTLVTLFGR